MGVTLRLARKQDVVEKCASWIRGDTHVAEAIGPVRSEPDVEDHVAEIERVGNGRAGQRGVFGVDDERFGQRVAAVASLESGASATPDDVLDEVRTRLSGYKLPKRLVLVGQIPRTATGKADYPTAKELYAAD